jgi:hypothetical protein
LQEDSMHRPVVDLSLDDGLGRRRYLPPHPLGRSQIDPDTHMQREAQGKGPA